MNLKIPFSERIGMETRKVLQVRDIDMDLRIDIWNVLYQIINDEVTQNFESNNRNLLMDKIYSEVLNKPIDEIAFIKEKFWYVLKKQITKADWYKVYNIIEKINDIFIKKRFYPSHKYVDKINFFLEKNNSAYRIIGEQITPISDEIEIQEIESVLEYSKGKFTGVYAHFSSAITLFSDREKPEYRNSIKESISAVESICKIICKTPKATLGEALKIIEKDKKIEIHGALKSGFEKIYGYTSDDSGIRHSMLNEVKHDFEDAKYMLVACSAFINYLIVKAEKAKIF